MDSSFLQDCQQSINKAQQWLHDRIDDKGAFNDAEDDIACYYKAPYLLYISGYNQLASKVLNYILSKYQLKNHDFASSKDYKTQEPFLNEFTTYINGWLAFSSHKMGRFDSSYVSYNFLRNFYHPEQGGFLTNHAYGSNGDNVMDVFTTAHLGMVALYFGDLQKAKRAGSFLQRCLSSQPDINAGFYLRIDNEGKHITSFAEENVKKYFLSYTKAEQYYFMLGYIVGFLGKLAAATADEDYMKTSRSYMELLLKSHTSMFESRLSNHVAWGAAVVANITREARYKKVAMQIAQCLISYQAEDGAWAKEDKAYTKYDATIENAIWLREILAEIEV